MKESNEKHLARNREYRTRKLKEEREKARQETVKRIENQKIKQGGNRQ